MMALRTASRKLHLRPAVARDAEHSPRLAKFIASEVAIIFFRFSVQHSEIKAHKLGASSHEESQPVTDEAVANVRKPLEGKG